MTDGSDLDLLVDAVGDLMADHCKPDALAAAEASGFSGPLWDALSVAGLTSISIPEERGGAGGTVREALAVVRLAGRYCAPVPYPETVMLGGWLADAAGFALPEGPLTVVPGANSDTLALRRHDGRWRVTGAATAVPWGSRAEKVIALLEAEGRWHIVNLPLARAQVRRRRGLSGEPRDDLLFTDEPVEEAHVVEAPLGVDRHRLLIRGALCRSLQMAGAMEAVAELTVSYANDRVQFGRPIARFQAVAHHLVIIAEEAARAALAADVASMNFDDDGWMEIAAAKIVAGGAAEMVTARAHQVHGAIGMTAEYRLHFATKRLWTWQQDFGSEQYWSREFGTILASEGAERLWPRVIGKE